MSMSRRGRSGRNSEENQPAVGLVVEGDAEFVALPLLYTKRLVPGCPPLKVTNLGGLGGDMSPQGIAKRVAPKVVEHQAAGRERVIFCLDREKRQQTAPCFAAQVTQALTRELKERGRTASDVHVIVVDRAFEAWLLADAQGLHARGKFKAAPTLHCFEGQLGERGHLGTIELGRLLGRFYDKRKDGAVLFAALDFSAARTMPPKGRGSRSLDKFLRTLGV